MSFVARGEPGALVLLLDTSCLLLVTVVICLSWVLNKFVYEQQCEVFKALEVQEDAEETV